MNGMTDETTDKTTKGTAMDDETTMAMPAADGPGRGDGTADATLTMPVGAWATDEGRAGERTVPMASVPLYATQPPAGAGTRGMPGTGGAGQGAAGGRPPAGGMPFGGQQPQPFVQVPVRPKPEPLRRTGPSVPTIVLGVLGILLGAVTLCFGLGFPTASYALADWIMAYATPETFLTLCVGGLGVLLLVIAAVWGVVRALRSRRTGDGAGDDVSDADGD